MYSIRSYILYFLLIYSALVVAVFVSYRIFIEYPSDIATIEEHQRRELESLNKGFDKSLDGLQAIVTDWAHWTDTYDYVLAPQDNQSFVDDNILSSTFDTFELLAIVIFDRDFNPVIAQGYDPNNAMLVNADTIFETALSSLFSNGVSPGDAWQNSGWLATQHGPAAFAIQYITNSNEDADPAGYLMFVQAITNEQEAALESITRLQLEFTSTSLSDPATHGVVSLKTPALVEGFQLQRKRLLDDFAGTPIMLVTITHDPLSVPELLGWSEVFTLLLLILVPAILMLAIDRRLIKPLWRNTNQIKAMVEKEDLTQLAQPMPVVELEHMRLAFNKSIDLVKHQQQQLLALSMTDSLTGIANRRAFDEHASAAWRHAVRMHEPFCLITMDLDYFKTFNDSLGHPEGDKALQAVGEKLQDFARRSGEICARVGGEEFALIVQAENADVASARAQALRDSIRELAITHPASPIANILTTSIGVLYIPQANISYRGVTLSELLSLVDKKLYVAKQNGRDQIEFHVLEKSS
ncbi:diguanylate cyclase domain-containing protein [Alteromonas flava]|uniref:sensor domain-containing diguanylate cyclase n=1 Tax=Alteromonas flava TaxID=2048003 RepID=UPI000C283C64|nr:diguanylate cyclase [Alteromonas flava]